MDYFKKDGLLRNAQGIPVGRVVLAEPYVEGENVKVATLTIPKGPGVKPKGCHFYVDGAAYIVPDDLSSVKITEYRNRWVLNTFVLEKVRS